MFQLKIDWAPVYGSVVQNVLNNILMTGLEQDNSAEVSSRHNIISVEPEPGTLTLNTVPGV